jgi:hypothetical protein
MAKTEAMKENKEDKLQELDARIKVETAAVSQINEDVKAAEDMIGKITVSVKESSEIREAAKKENKAAIEESTKAQEAILKAIEVLQAFYKDSGMIAKEPWEFLQEPVKLPKEPSTWDSAYTGVTDPQAQPSGIIAVLKALNANFVQMASETKSQEIVDQQQFDEQMQKEAIEKARRRKEVEMKENHRLRKTETIAQLTSSRRNIGVEQDKTVQYLKDLEPACVIGDSSYEKRKQARDTEITSLQKAQNYLEDAFDSSGEGKDANFLARRVQVHTIS